MPKVFLAKTICDASKKKLRQLFLIRSYGAREPRLAVSSQGEFNHEQSRVQQSS